MTPRSDSLRISNPSSSVWTSSSPGLAEPPLQADKADLLCAHPDSAVQRPQPWPSPPRPHDTKYNILTIFRHTAPCSSVQSRCSAALTAIHPDDCSTKPNANGVRGHVPLPVRPMSLSIMFSRFTHVVACVRTSFLSEAG